MATIKKTAKTVSKKPAAKKSAAKKSVKKIAPAKKQAKSIAKAKPVAKKTSVKPVKSSLKKSPKLIHKPAPAKKAAKPVAKKAVSKKVATPKKTSTKKSNNPAAKKTATSNKITSKGTTKSSNKKQENKKLIISVLPKAKDIKVPPPKHVALPKITATKARKYEPEFLKSVLDHAPQENNGPTMRYSDGELNEFRELIQRKLETAKKELGYLQGLITRKDEMGGDDTDNRYMTMEDGSLSMEREQLSQMASRQITFIDHLEKAMMRIENKTYGICRVTGKLIDKARLRAVPHATLSIEAKMGIAR